MPLLNYSTRKDPMVTVGEITAILARKGARKVMQEYDNAGAVVGMKWSMEGPYGMISYSMPVNHEAVFKILTRENLIYKTNEQKRRAQANRVAWRILKDWIVAQIALLETGMVEMEEIFLPYMLAGPEQNTLFKTLASDNFHDLKTIGSNAIPLPPPPETD